MDGWMDGWMDGRKDGLTGAHMDGWIDDIEFYVPFNSKTVISGQWLDDNERLYAVKCFLGLFCGEIQAWVASFIEGQRLIHRAARCCRRKKSTIFAVMGCEKS